MPENTDNQNNKTEYCSICRRSDSDAGSMFHLPGGINMCSDCMRTSLESMSRFGFADPFNTRAGAAVQPKEQEKTDAEQSEKTIIKEKPAAGDILSLIHI